METIFKLIDEICHRYKFLYYIRFALFVLLLVSLIFSISKLYSSNTPVPTNPTTLKPVYTYKDKYDQLRSEIEVIEINNRKEFNRLTDSFKKVLKGRTQIKSVSTIATVTEVPISNIPVQTNPTDSTYYFIKEDNHVSIYGSLDTKTREASISYQSFDTTNYIMYTKKRFLRSNINTLNISNTNPYNKILAGSSVELKEQKVLFVVGPYLGYDAINNKLGAGVGVTFNLFSIKTRK